MPTHVLELSTPTEEGQSAPTSLSRRSKTKALSHRTQESLCKLAGHRTTVGATSDAGSCHPLSPVRAVALNPSTPTRLWPTARRRCTRTRVPPLA